MSVKIMSAIFETEFRDLPDSDGNLTKASTAKLVLLALADHANDEGESAYPSIEKLARKTALSAQTIRNTFDALRHNGVIFLNGVSKYRTNNYSINTKSFPKLMGEDGTVLTLNPLEGQMGEVEPSNGSLLTLNPLDPNHHITINKTSSGADAPKSLEWEIAHDNPVTDEMINPLDFRDSANLIATGMGTSAQDAYALAFAFMEERGMEIHRSKIKAQRKAIREMLEMRVKPEHIRQAVKELREKRMTITDMFSVSKTAIHLANEPKPQPKESEYKTL